MIKDLNPAPQLIALSLWVKQAGEWTVWMRRPVSSRYPGFVASDAENDGTLTGGRRCSQAVTRGQVDVDGHYGD